MSWLSIYAPSLHIAAVTSKLTKGAKHLGNDDGRTLDQRKADLALTWLTTGQLHDIDLTADIALTLPASALAGATNTPAVAYDGSWVAPPAWIAELATTADVFWHRMVLDPVTNDVLTHEYLGRYSPDILTKAIAFRHGVCQAPGCLKPALECDQDHRIPHDQGGPTTGFNMGPFCRCDHRHKGHGILTWSWTPDPPIRSRLTPDDRTTTLRPMLNGEFNEDALEAMYQELTDNLQLVDNGLRRQGLLGKPIDEIKPHAASALASVGVHLPEEKLTDYAHALSAGEKYAFDLAAKRPERKSLASRWFKSWRER